MSGPKRHMPAPSDTAASGPPATFAETAARGVCYNRVGELLLRPDEALFGGLADGSLLGEVARVRRTLLDGTCTRGADAALEELEREAERVAAAGLPALGAEHEKAFGHAAAVDHPPHEMHYGGVNLFQQTHQLSDVVGFYRAFGVDVPENLRERPDHVGIEMEFLGLLCVKEANAIQNGLEAEREVTRRAGRRFIARHVGGFVPTLYLRVANRGPSSFYCAVLRFASELLGEDRARLGIPPEEVRRHAFMAAPPPEAEEEGCFGCSELQMGNTGEDA